MMDYRDNEKNIQAYLHFLLRSIRANGGKGSSAFYSRFRYPLRGWSPAYPETTGYIILSLIQAEKQLGISLTTHIKSCIAWLCEEVQLPSGAFPSLYAGNNKESLFNSAQVALGLLAFNSTDSGDERMVESERGLLNWLVENVDKKEADIHYQQGFIPAYYTRVVWPCLLMAQKYKQVDLKERALNLLEGILETSLRARSFPKAAGFSGDKAFSHTLAYTVRGLLEVNEIHPCKEREELLSRLIDAQIKALSDSNGLMAGSYQSNWKGDFTFRCLTGEYQWAIVFLRMYERTSEQVYIDQAESLLKQDFSSGLFFTKGALYGSKPFWKSYMPFKAPNWAAKFGLDALLLYKKIKDDKA